MGLLAGLLTVLAALLMFHWPRLSHFVRFYITHHSEQRALWLADLERRQVADALGFPRVLKP